MWRRPRMVTADTKLAAMPGGRGAFASARPQASPRAGRRCRADNATAERREADLPVAREDPRLASVASRVTARHVQGCDVSRRSANPLARGSAATKVKKRKKNPEARMHQEGR